MALQNLRGFRHGFGEAVEDVRRRVVKPDLDEHQRSPADLARIEHRPDRGDEPVAEQALHPLAGSGRRQPDTPGKIKRRPAPVFLQQPEQAAVYLVEVAHSQSTLYKRFVC